MIEIRDMAESIVESTIKERRFGPPLYIVEFTHEARRFGSPRFEKTESTEEEPPLRPPPPSLRFPPGVGFFFF